jgi:dUTP pyrophosphatase
MEGAELPHYAHSGDAGLDLCSAESAILSTGSRRLIRTGIAIELPANTEGQIRSRSGLALEHGIIVFNSPGTIDSGFRGEICVLLANFGVEDFAVTQGMRIAQLVISQVRSVDVIEVPELSTLTRSDRGTDGLGSTGKI